MNIEKGQKMDHKNEYTIIKELIETVKETVEKSDKDNFDPNFYMTVLQAEGALERVKDKTQSVENFVDSLQKAFK
tara:strand:+ start:247 stop:471 length:225 start_codon:yes stop_codon:yes gene_type:complete